MTSTPSSASQPTSSIWATTYFPTSSSSSSTPSSSPSFSASSSSATQSSSPPSASPPFAPPSSRPPCHSNFAKNQSPARWHRNITLMMFFRVFNGVAYAARSAAIFDNYVHLTFGSNAAIGLITSFSGFASLLCAPLAGFLADNSNYSRSRILRACSLATVVCMAMNFLALFRPTLPKLVLSTVLWRSWYEFVFVVSEALFVDSIPHGERSRFLTYRRVVTSLSHGVGPLFSLLLFAYCGDAWTKAVLDPVLKLSVFLTLPQMIILWRWMDVPRSASPPPLSVSSSSSSAPSFSFPNGLLGSGSRDCASASLLAPPSFSPSGFAQQEASQENSTACPSATAPPGGALARPSGLGRGGAEGAGRVTGAPGHAPRAAAERNKREKPNSSQIAHTSSTNFFIHPHQEHTHSNVKSNVNTTRATSSSNLRNNSSSSDSSNSANHSISNKYRFACFTTTAVPWILFTSQIVTFAGAGMTVKYLLLFFRTEYRFGPRSCCLLAAGNTVGVSLMTIIIQRVALVTGRAQASMLFTVSGLGCLLALIHVRSAVGVVLLYWLRASLQNASAPIDRSIMTDFVRPENLGKWTALQGMATMTWAVSAVVGGLVADAQSYRATFSITALIYVLANIIYLPLLRLVPVKEADAVWVAAAARNEVAPFPTTGRPADDEESQRRDAQEEQDDEKYGAATAVTVSRA
eukprot:GHVT01073011.1.p1 GENE.GHVT01073011.1~~GHVT01073011.1.p1  ORF type:complete len:691 (+),score=150.60 GHVT01073011.1:72-2144(+)